MQVFEQYESQVRSYCRRFPEVFTHASGAWLTGRSGQRYLDFLAGAGALNYGHNPPALKQALLAYLEADGVLQGLDLATDAKERCLLAFNEIILAPRQLAYRMLFPGPTGANCIEVALKLARKATGRRTVVAFSRGFHGMSLGALAATAEPFHRVAAGVPLEHVVFLPFDGEAGVAPGSPAALDLLEAGLLAACRGDEKPAACLLETVQGEGGCNVATVAWLQHLQALCRAEGVLLIVDDIQAGCGRSGAFFSFERAGLEPDIVCLSKSLSGYGLPMSLALVQPACDVLAPGQHSGTFRGNNAAFVTATAALETYWRSDALCLTVAGLAEQVQRSLAGLVARHPQLLSGQRGLGLLQGLVFRDGEMARRVSARCFSAGLIIETCGRNGEVVKILCPLTIASTDLQQGLDILSAALAWAAGD